MGTNEIYVRNTIIDFYKDGKSKDEIVDFFIIIMVYFYGLQLKGIR